MSDVWTTPVRSMERALRDTWRFCSIDSGRPVLQDVCVRTAGDRIEIAASNGHILIRRLVSATPGPVRSVLSYLGEPGGEIAESFSAVIKKETLRRFREIVKEVDPSARSVLRVRSAGEMWEDPGCLVEDDDTVLVIGQEEPKYPGVRKLIPERFAGSGKIGPRELAKQARLASNHKDDAATDRLRIEFKPDDSRIELGANARCVVVREATGAAFAHYVNRDYLVAVAQTLRRERDVSIRWKPDQTDGPVVFSAGVTTCLVMPMVPPRGWGTM